MCSFQIILELLGDGSVDPAPALSAGQPPASSPAARAARSFLLGFATLACAAQPDEATALVPLSPPQGPADIGQQAARHFFSAANGVGLKAANAQPGHGSSAAEAAASSVLGITSFLEGSFLAGSTSQADMFTAPPYSVDDGDEETGADMDTGAEGVGSLPQTWEASRKVRYYEAVMRLLERYGQSQLAVLFASAALELVSNSFALQRFWVLGSGFRVPASIQKEMLCLQCGKHEAAGGRGRAAEGSHPCVGSTSWPALTWYALHLLYPCPFVCLGTLQLCATCPLCPCHAD